MNDTAKKLREAAEYIGDGGACSDTAIVTVRGMFDVGRTDTFGGDLGLVLDIIADELDELDDKATRRRSHIVKLESTIAERNRELRDLRKQVPTERERGILDMWPRFEDSEYVWFGDEVACRGKACMLDDVKFVSDGTFHDETYLYVSNGLDVFEVPIAAGERVKRPARSVLDADGVETRSGDTVYLLKDGGKCRVTGFETIDGEVFARLHCDDRPEIEGARGSAITHRRRVLDSDGVEIKVGDTVWDINDPHGYEMTVDRIELDALGHVRTLCEKPSPSSLSIHPNRLTHTRPDSWERLEEDAEKESCQYFGRSGYGLSACGGCPADGTDCEATMCLDIVRRAKALAGIEAAE